MIETPQESFLMINEEQRFALHSIDKPNNLSFDRYAYSRYKYGDTNQAKRFGEELCQRFVEDYRAFLLASKQEFLAISSPRGLIPPAAYYIFQTFLQQLNRFLQSNERPPVLEHTIQRLGTLAEDYSLLPRHERFNHLIHERYSIDKQPIADKFLLFIDDIRITGMHEMNIIRLLQTSQIYNPRLFIYFAQLTNEQIPSSFEHQLNRCAIENLPQLLTIIHNPLSLFQINTRVLKEILRSDLSELEQFFRSISADRLAEFYHASLACHYQSIDTFVDALDYLHRCLEERRVHAHSNIMNEKMF